MLTRTTHTPVWLGSGQTSWQMGFDEPRAQIIFRAVTIPPNYNLISQSDLDCHQRIVSPVFHSLQVTLNSTYALAYNSVRNQPKTFYFTWDILRFRSARLC